MAVSAYSAVMVHLQRQCMRFQGPAGAVVFTSNRKLLAKLPVEKYLIVGPDASRHPDRAWSQYLQLRFGSVGWPNKRSPLFLGMLRNRVVGEKLVAVWSEDGGGGLVRMVIQPRFLYLLPTKDDSKFTQHPFNAPLLSWATYYQGSSDPEDSSRFTIPFDYDDGSGQVKGHLRDDGLIEIQWFLPEKQVVQQAHASNHLD